MCLDHACAKKKLYARLGDTNESLCLRYESMSVQNVLFGDG